MSESTPEIEVHTTSETGPVPVLRVPGSNEALAPVPPELPVEGVASTSAESRPLVSGKLGALLGMVSMLAAAGAGFSHVIASVLGAAALSVPEGVIQGALVVLALAAGLVVGKYAVEAPGFAAGKPLVQGPWLTLAAGGALHLGNLAAVLPPGLGFSLAVAGCALCCLLAGLPFSRPVRR